MEKKNNKSKVYHLLGMFLVISLLLLSGCHSIKRLPTDISMAGDRHATRDISFLKDVTYTDAKGVRHVEQEIFDEIFDLIGGAKQLVLVDMFLYNDFQGPIPEKTRALSGELTDLLIRKKQGHPAMDIYVITDPINNVYGGIPSKQFARLREAGISVTITDLDRLRDSNTFYSPLWRLIFKPFGNDEGGLFPNLLGNGRISFRSYMKLMNFKANHRKVLIVDSGDSYVGLVTSANPHDGSSAHGNVAVKFSGPAVKDLLEAELAVLAFSEPDAKPIIRIDIQQQESDVYLQVVTEKKIKDAVLKSIQETAKGDRVDLAMFYLSDRDVIKTMLDADERGADLRILLDPNKDAFGRKKNGIPNRPVAHEFHKRGIPVRWCDTHGEQCHAKMLHIRDRHGANTLILGSANFTRRNLDDFNLETNVNIQGPSDAEVFMDANRYFEKLWNNNPQNFSLEYPAYEDSSAFRRFMYHLKEATGFSSF